MSVASTVCETRPIQPSAFDTRTDQTSPASGVPEKSSANWSAPTPSVRFQAVPLTTGGVGLFSWSTSFEKCVVLATLAMPVPGSRTSPPSAKLFVCEAEAACVTSTVNGVPSVVKTTSLPFVSVPVIWPTLCRLVPVTVKLVANDAPLMRL